MTRSPKEVGPLFFKEQDRVKGGPPAEICAPDYASTINSAPEFDRAGHDQFAKMFYIAFPDLEHIVENVVADGESVAVQFIIRGTNSGSFMGMPPTGKSISACGIAIMQVENGRVKRLRGIFDQMTMMRQLQDS
jgi:steroid delta-isomerase-like uncharacterized protein